MAIVSGEAIRSRRGVLRFVAGVGVEFEVFHAGAPAVAAAGSWHIDADTIGIHGAEDSGSSCGIGDGTGCDRRRVPAWYVLLTKQGSVRRHSGPCKSIFSLHQRGGDSAASLENRAYGVPAWDPFEFGMVVLLPALFLR